uniref:Cyclin D binding myb like transcription factor 1 n=1 Tax=Pseudonaja textilis TaxID=8673 RepID=A0A670ZMF8_PSETE
MTTVEEECDTVTVETVNSVTLTQDTQGNLILHCPQDEADGVDSEDSPEPPPHKRLCLSSEDDESVEGNPPCISVVAVPISESDQSFEVTMTATTEVADHEVNEGTVTQIQILQNEQLDEISSLANEEVSAVSQAWFTTKEDKDCLTNKGHKWKQGMWSKEEIQILMSNIERYLKARGIKDATEIIFEMSKDERKDFYRTIAWGLNRPLFAVYRRVLRMYDDRNHVGKYTPEEIEKLKEEANGWESGAHFPPWFSSPKARRVLRSPKCDKSKAVWIVSPSGKWTEKEEKRLAEVVHELTSTEPGDIVTQGVSWAAVAERVGSRSEKQCRSKWLNYLNWKQSGGTEWTKEDEINLILRIAELEVADENGINWDLLAEGWSSVRSPQWLRSKWWTIKRQIANHKEVSFPASADSPAASVDSETITLNSGTLQTFEILPSFHLQPTGTPGTYLLQTSSSQGLPLTLTASPTVTLTAAAAPASPDQIIVHALSPEHLLNTTENVTVQCHAPSVIIRTMASEDVSPPASQAELSADLGLQTVGLAGTPTSLETDSFPEDVRPSKLPGEDSAGGSSKFGSQSSPELLERAGVGMLNSDLKREDNCPSDLAGTYVSEDLGSPTAEEPVEQSSLDGAILIVPSPRGFIQASDDIDGEPVLPLTTLTDPILQHHGENSHITSSSLDSPSSEDSKGMENLVSCH